MTSSKLWNFSFILTYRGSWLGITNYGKEFEILKIDLQFYQNSRYIKNLKLNIENKMKIFEKEQNDGMMVPVSIKGNPIRFIL